MVLGGSKCQRVGRVRPQDSEKPWKFSYEWSDEGTELEVSGSRPLSKEEMLEAVQSQLDEKNKLKQEAIQVEGFLEAARLKKEIDVLEQEFKRVQSMEVSTPNPPGTLVWCSHLYGRRGQTLARL